jgi:sporulation integral membrane protein YtvI
MDWRVPDATRLLNAHLGTAYQLAAAVIRAVGLTLLALPNALLVAALTLIATFFLLRDKGVWVHAGDWLVPPAYRRRLPDLQGEVVRGTLGFVRAQLLVVGSTTLATTLGLWVYGSRYALLLGLAAGLLDLVPFLGPSALLGPWAVVMAVSGHPWAALELAAVLTGVLLVRQLTEPRLVAQGTGLHPLTALVALYVGIRLFGPWGFVVGPVTALILKAAARAAELPPYQAAPGP